MLRETHGIFRFATLRRAWHIRRDLREGAAIEKPVRARGIDRFAIPISGSSDCRLLPVLAIRPNADNLPRRARDQQEYRAVTALFFRSCIFSAFPPFPFPPLFFLYAKSERFGHILYVKRANSRRKCIRTQCCNFRSSVRSSVSSKRELKTRIHRRATLPDWRGATLESSVSSKVQIRDSRRVSKAAS